MTARVGRVEYLLPLAGVLAFWAGIGMAGWEYPRELDWRYMTLSTLLSPNRNPAGHLWARLGLVLTACCNGWWALALGRHREAERSQRFRWAPWVLGAGSLCMLWVGCLSRPLPWIRKGHEVLTLLAFAGVCLGLLGLSAQCVRRRFARWGADGERPRFVIATLAFLLLFPIVLAGATQAYVFYLLPQLPWVGLRWRAVGVPVYLSVAFWEWINCAVLSGYLVIVGCALGRQDRLREAVGATEENTAAAKRTTP